MVKSNILYYPNFEPDPFWLKNMLLFFDSIGRIMPKDYDYSPSYQISELLDMDPNCLDDIEPKEKFVKMNSEHLDRFEKAFKIINPNPKNKRKFKLSIDNENRVSCKGYSFLHSSKFCERIKQLLYDYELIFDKKIPNIDKNLFLIEDTASNLILSYLADNLANNYGLNTVTDHSMDYAMQLLNSLNINKGNIANGVLASSIIKVYIPKDLSKLPINDYFEIRDQFSDIRGLFNRTITEMSLINRLDKIEDADVLNARAKQISNEFIEQYTEFQKNYFKKQFVRFTPIIIGNIFAISAAAINQVPLAIGSSVSSFIIQVVQELSVETENPNSKLFKLMSGIEKEIFYREEIKNLI